MTLMTKVQEIYEENYYNYGEFDEELYADVITTRVECDLAVDLVSELVEAYMDAIYGNMDY